MSATPDDKRQPWWMKVTGGVLATAAQPGWGRRLLLAVSIVLIVLALYVLRKGADYRENPSVLVPRTARMYLETRDVETLFNDIASWPLWVDKRRFSGEDTRDNKLLSDTAGRLGSRVGGLGTRLPMNWLAGATRAAFCLEDGDAEDEVCWALYLHLDKPSDILKDLAVEPGLTLETVRKPAKGGADQGLYYLIGGDEGELCFGVLGPWLIVSSDDKLPNFAIDSLRKPALTLGYARLLPEWKRGRTVRGIYDPSRTPLFDSFWRTAETAGWLAPDARQAFSGTVTRDGGLDLAIVGARLEEDTRSGGIWPVIRFAIVVLGLIGLAVVAVTVLFMLNWAGWLKLAARRAGVSPKAAPAGTTPSPAFLEDSGAKPEAGAGGDAGTSAESVDSAASSASSAISSGEGTSGSDDYTTHETSEPGETANQNRDVKWPES